MELNLTPESLRLLEQAASERGLTNLEFVGLALDQAISNSPIAQNGKTGVAALLNKQKLFAAENIYVKHILAELERAMQKYPRPFASQMEAAAVIQAQWDRLWIACKAGEWGHARSAAIKLGAMVLRFLVDC